MSLIAPHPSQAARAEAFHAALDDWTKVAPHYAPHSEMEAYAPAILAACFDQAEAIPRGYLLGCPVGAILLNAGNWRWHDMAGTVIGRGLHQLWAWRFGMSVERAHAEIWATIHDHELSPPNAARRRRRA